MTTIMSFQYCTPLIEIPCSYIDQLDHESPQNDAMYSRIQDHQIRNYVCIRLSTYDTFKVMYVQRLRTQTFSSIQQSLPFPSTSLQASTKPSPSILSR